ncbi:hypothetical protein LJR231_005595 [Phyllobacterium sp. LjRoot231]|uniref:hypothetical protein n=1 Tax=Phyllobacterium sp. LjRoot231 TaxID=3342289 RepID=UPI003ECD6BBE
MSEQNKTLVRRVVEEVYNQGNLAVADELSASDLVIHQTSQQIRGREGPSSTSRRCEPRSPTFT